MTSTRPSRTFDLAAALRMRPYSTFVGLAVLLAIVATLGSDVVARTSIGGQSFAAAAKEHLYYAATQPVGTALLIAPFLLLGWIAASAAKQKGLEAGFAVFLAGAILLGLMYFSDYQDSRISMKERRWTAATLSIGFLPFKSIPLLLLCLGVRWLIVRKRAAA